MPDNVPQTDSTNKDLILDCIQKQTLECDEKYVFEKVFWKRSITALVAAIGIVVGVAGGSFAWALTTSNKIQENTSGRHAMEQRLERVERQNEQILKNLQEAADNQQEILVNQQALSRKFDVIINRSSNGR